MDFIVPPRLQQSEGDDPKGMKLHEKIVACGKNPESITEIYWAPSLVDGSIVYRQFSEFQSARDETIRFVDDLAALFRTQRR